MDSTKPASSKSLSTGAKIGIGVGASVCCVILIFIVMKMFGGGGKATGAVATASPAAAAPKLDRAQELAQNALKLHEALTGFS